MQCQGAVLICVSLVLTRQWSSERWYLATCGYLAGFYTRTKYNCFERGTWVRTTCLELSFNSVAAGSQTHDDWVTLC